MIFIFRTESYKINIESAQLIFQKRNHFFFFLRERNIEIKLLKFIDWNITSVKIYRRKIYFSAWQIKQKNISQNILAILQKLWQSSHHYSLLLHYQSSPFNIIYFITLIVIIIIILIFKAPNWNIETLVKFDIIRIQLYDILVKLYIIFCSTIDLNIISNNLGILIEVWPTIVLPETLNLVLNLYIILLDLNLIWRKKKKTRLVKRNPQLNSRKKGNGKRCDVRPTFYLLCFFYITKFAIPTQLSGLLKVTRILSSHKLVSPCKLVRIPF